MPETYMVSVDEVTLVTSDRAEARFRDLYDRHHRQVLAYLMRRSDRDTAFDAAEDVFLVAWRRLNDVPEGHRALPWLYGVARNVLANHQRSFARRARLWRKLTVNPPNPPRPTDAEAIDHAAAEQMMAALATLRQGDQEVLRLTYWEELPHAAIGKILGCSTEAVHVRRYRAEKRLANALARAGHKPDRRSAVLPQPQEGRGD